MLRKDRMCDLRLNRNAYKKILSRFDQHGSKIKLSIKDVVILNCIMRRELSHSTESICPEIITYSGRNVSDDKQTHVRRNHARL